ncbi:phage head-tail connector protein [Sphingomonas sp. R-74633]|uniref:phage head-tail connector protein n=1 Tax=Sphingomonas sp. R-74633 TaxID=2751188 RepID=UPI0015D10FBD|nr:phage head-tail connector protein [Sphingomonas sp. R-74633]NYT42467.1 phage head-tail connector protein [Sphingomonas sp. R-74633]
MDSPPFPSAVIEAAREAAKAHLRIAGASEDALIEGLAASALALAEAFTGTALIARDFSEDVESKRHWKALTMAPVTEIDAGIDVAIDIDTQGLGWVRASGRVTVGYRAGTAAGWGDLPPPIATGVVLLVAHLFDHRENGLAPPAAVSALWRPWRRVRLAA